MCGTAAPSGGAKRATVPPMTPSPRAPGVSSLPEKRSCIPRQTPKKGRSPSPRYRRSAPTAPMASSAATADPNAPTPGNTRISAASMSAAVRTSLTSHPSRSSAFVTLRTLPAP